MGFEESSSVAKAGLTTGIIGTTLAGLMALGGNGGGLLGGGLFGNNNAQMAAMGVLAEKDAKIAELTAQKYSDNQDAVLYQATRSENEKLENRLMAFITPLSNEAAQNRERVAVLESQMKSNAEIAELREKNIRLELGGRIDAVAQACDCGIRQNSAAIAALQNTVNGITQTIIPQSVICPPVMPRYNAWQAPATTDVAPATQPISGTVRVQRS